MFQRLSLGGSRTIALLVGSALAARVVVTLLLPPLTDVYYYHTQAVSVLAGLSDPYGHVYSGIPPALATPGAATVYAYLPGALLFLFSFGLLWDIRLGLIAADLAIACCIYLLGGRRAGWAAVAFVLAPWGFFFATVSPNSSLPAMAFLGMAFLLEKRGQRSLSAVALGASLASSQFVWLAYPFILVRQVLKKDIGSVCISLASAAVMILPFLLWNSGAFIYDTVTFQFIRPPAAIVTPTGLGANVNATLSGLAQALFGASVPFAVKVAVTAALLVVLLRKSRTFAGQTFYSSVFVTAAIFVLPENFSTCYLELPFQLLLISVVLSAPNPVGGPAVPATLKGTPGGPDGTGG